MRCAELKRSGPLGRGFALPLLLLFVFEASFFFAVIPAVWYLDGLLPPTGRSWLLGFVLWAYPTVRGRLPVSNQAIKLLCTASPPPPQPCL